MKFTKMHGLGNDYVYVNGFAEHVEHPEAVSRRVADRHFGIGGDGLILVLPPSSPAVKADVRMRMFNADGSEGEMCGNGVRCVAKYAYDHGLSKSNPLKVETGRGVLPIELQVDAAGKVATATVDMGEPTLELSKIPVQLNTDVTKTDVPHTYRVSMEYEHGGFETFDGVFVSTGNPHVVIFTGHEMAKAVTAANRSQREWLGSLIENWRIFPKRTNVHWAHAISRNELVMHTWERGSGLTMACGTGACAVLVAAVLTGRCDRQAIVHLPGGDLNIRWDEATNHVFMTGPATEVFSGEIAIP